MHWNNRLICCNMACTCLFPGLHSVCSHTGQPLWCCAVKGHFGPHTHPGGFRQALAIQVLGSWIGIVVQLAEIAHDLPCHGVHASMHDVHFLLRTENWNEHDILMICRFLLRFFFSDAGCYAFLYWDWEVGLLSEIRRKQYMTGSRHRLANLG